MASDDRTVDRRVRRVLVAGPRRIEGCVDPLLVRGCLDRTLRHDLIE